MVTCRKKLDYARLFWITLCFCFRGPDASAQSLFGVQHPISLEPDQSEVVASGDLDGDGDMDLVVGSRNADRKTNRGLIWYENQHASGYYVERSIEFRNIAVSDVQLVDLDQDGDLDIVASESWRNNHYVLFWHDNLDGKGTFGPRINISSANDQQITSLHVADLDSDGDNDVVFGSIQERYRGSFQISWYQDVDGKQGFHSKKKIDSITHFGAAVYLDVSDVNGDSKPDIIASFEGDKGLGWYKNRIGTSEVAPPASGFSPFSPTAEIQHYASRFTLADMNADGMGDLVTANDHVVAILMNDRSSSGFGTETVVDGYFQDVLWAHSADLDLDGDLDVVAGSAIEIRFYEYVNGLLAFNSSQTIPFGGEASTLSDVDADGDSDLVVFSKSSKHVSGQSGVSYWFENQTRSAISLCHIVAQDLVLQNDTVVREESLFVSVDLVNVGGLVCGKGWTMEVVLTLPGSPSEFVFLGSVERLTEDLGLGESKKVEFTFVPYSARKDVGISQITPGEIGLGIRYQEKGKSSIKSTQFRVFGEAEMDLHSSGVTLFQPTSSAGKRTDPATQSEDWIRLKSRVFRPERMVPSGEAPTGGFRLIQFDVLPSDHQKRTLEGQGVEFVRFVPDKALVVWIPKGLNLNQFSNVRWFGRLEEADRMSGPAALRFRGRGALDPEQKETFMIEAFRDKDVSILRREVHRWGGHWESGRGLPANHGMVRGSREMFQALLRFDELARIDIIPARSRGDDIALFCSGAMTEFGAVASFAASGVGWDGPGQGSARLTYRFGGGTEDMSGSEEFDEFRRALREWSDYVDFDFQEVVDPYRKRSIDINWINIDGRRGGTLAQAYLPTAMEPLAGDIMFDEKELWSTTGNLGVGNDSIQVFAVAMHEIGHSIGLLHSENPNAIMYGNYVGPRVGLAADDIIGAQSLYASRLPLLVISNRGDADLIVTSIDAPNWLSVGIRNTVIPADSSLSLEFSVDWALVTDPVAVGEITVYSNDRTGSVSSMNVTAISEQAQMNFTPEALTISVLKNEATLIPLGLNGLPNSGALIQVKTKPRHGEITIVGNQIWYTSDTHFTGQDTFTFQGQIGSYITPEATATIHVVSQEKAGMQIVNSLEGLPMDVYLDDQLVGDDVYAGSVTAFTNTLSGFRKIGIADSSSTSSTAVVYSQYLNVLEHANTTVILSSTAGNTLRLKSFTTSDFLDSTGHQIRFYNDLSAIPVRISQKTDQGQRPSYQPFAQDLQPGEMSPFVEMETGLSLFRVFNTALGYDQTHRVNLMALVKSTQAGILGWIRDSELIFVDSTGTVVHSLTATAQEIPEELPVSLSVSSAFPNPATNHVFLELALPEHANVMIQLFDLLGRRQSGSIKSVLTAGRGRRVRLDTSRLAAGAYIARVTVSGQRGLQKSVPLVVIR
ncbi:MAG: matrixin family metalloprotease [Rhodothermales bacterium]|nr:matrixin family metalloprotease [Rhodothermales bacterium]